MDKDRWARHVARVMKVALLAITSRVLVETFRKSMWRGCSR